MVDIEKYISQFIALLKSKYESRLVYVGLQGSYLRGEATDASDIDIMVVIDELSVSDLDDYRDIIRSLEEPEKSCGFICSKRDLASWNPLEICHLLHSTKDYYGTLKRLVPAYTREDVRNFTKVSVNNMYHEICHRYIHADREENAAGLLAVYKGVFFILQNLYYLENGEFLSAKAQLLSALSGKNKEVLEVSMQMSSGKKYEFAESFELLFSWCQDTMEVLR